MPVGRGQCENINFSNANRSHGFEEDLLRRCQEVFSTCDNLKHHCVLKVFFFGCIRSGELCNLDDPDYDPANLTSGLRPGEAIQDHRIQGSPKDAFCQPPEI